MFGAKKSDINTQKFQDMYVFWEAMDALPDGAFFAAAAERGWDVEDWGWFQEVQDLNKKTI